MNADIVAGFFQAVQPVNLMATGIGALLGLIVGMIPGMTISTGIIVLLPLTFVLDPNMSIALLLGLYVAGMTGEAFQPFCSTFQAPLQPLQQRLRAIL